MNSIRYWDQQQVSVATQQGREKRQAAQQVTQSFQSNLWDKMAALGGSSLPDFSTGMTSMMGDNPMANLMQVNVDGIEKVWAEQLKHPQSFFNMGNSRDEKNAGMGALDGALSMAVQVSMIKAKKHLQQQTTNYGLNAFMGDVGVSASVDEQMKALTSSVDEFVSNMQLQMRQASKQYGLTVDELKRRLSVE
jgi:hypothetical protein